MKKNFLRRPDKKIQRGRRNSGKAQHNATFNSISNYWFLSWRRWQNAPIDRWKIHNPKLLCLISGSSVTPSSSSPWLSTPLPSLTTVHHRFPPLINFWAAVMEVVALFSETSHYHLSWGSIRTTHTTYMFEVSFFWVPCKNLKKKLDSSSFFHSKKFLTVFPGCCSKKNYRNSQHSWTASNYVSKGIERNFWGSLLSSFSPKQC